MATASVYTNTLGEMIDLFGVYVGEPDVNNSRWGQDARIKLLNIVQLELAEETRCIEDEWTSSVTAYTNPNDERVTIGASCYDDAIIQVYWLDSDDEYHPLTEKHIRHSSRQNDDTGTPSQFFRIGRNVHLVPKPDAAGTAVIVGQRVPDALVNTTDVSLIPAAYRHGVVYGAVRDALLEDDEYSKADRWAVKYDRLQVRLKKYAKKRRNFRASKFVLPRSL